MSGLELSLKILIDLEGLSHLLINDELIRNCEWYQELSSICLSLKFLESGDNPVQDMLDCSLVTVHHISHEAGTVVRGIPEDFQEPTDSLLGLILSLFLDINSKV